MRINAHGYFYVARESIWPNQDLRDLSPWPHPVKWRHNLCFLRSLWLLQQKKQDKLTTTFESEPYKVVDKVGPQVTIESPEGARYKRNVQMTKKYVNQKDNKETQPSKAADLPESVENMQPTKHSPPQQVTQNCETSVRRSERARSTPVKLKDYVPWIQNAQ